MRDVTWTAPKQPSRACGLGAVLLALFLFPTSAAAQTLAPGQPPPSLGAERLTGTPGSYAMLFDGRSSPLMIAYWIAPSTILLFYGPQAYLIPGPNSLLLVDRALLPGRFVFPYTIEGMELRYRGELPAPDADGRSVSATIAVEAHKIGLFRPPELDRIYELTFRWTGRHERRLASGPVIAYGYAATRLYLLDSGRPRHEEGEVARAFLPALGLDIDEATWQAVERVVTGSTLSSVDLALLSWIEGDVPEAAKSCLRELRDSAQFKAHSERFAALERRNEGLFAAGMNDVLVFGFEAYTELERRHPVAREFNQCLTRS